MNVFNLLGSKIKAKDWRFSGDHNHIRRLSICVKGMFLTQYDLKKLKLWYSWCQVLLTSRKGLVKYSAAFPLHKPKHNRHREIKIKPINTKPHSYQLEDSLTSMSLRLEFIVIKCMEGLKEILCHCTTFWSSCRYCTLPLILFKRVSLTFLRHSILGLISREL